MLKVLVKRCMIVDGSLISRTVINHHARAQAGNGLLIEYREEFEEVQSE